MEKVDKKEKVCRDCNISKPLLMYRKLSKEKDKLDYRCIDCRRIYERTRPSILNPMPKEKRKILDNRKALNFPEKIKARRIAKRMIREKGFNCHHWNYNDGFGKDVIMLSREDHLYIHRFLTYDAESFLYRDKEGNLLDTKEKHQTYLTDLLTKLKEDKK